MALRQIFKTQITDVDTTARDTVGSLRWEGDKLYKYIKLANVTATVAGVAGDPVAYKATYAAGIAVHTGVLDLTDADTQPICAGFLMGTVVGTAGTAYYCWVQLTGAVVVPTAIGGTPVIGNGVQLDTSSGTDKTLVKHSGEVEYCGVSTSTTAANNTIIAKCAY